MKKLKPLTIDDIRAGSSIELYHKWLKKVRKEDKKENERIKRKIYNHKNKDKINAIKREKRKKNK